MNRSDFDRFCATLSGVSHVVQWGGSSVWKVGGKVFAIHNNWGDLQDAVTLKPTEMTAEIWRGAEGVALAPYLGRAGWFQIAPTAMEEDELKVMIAGSHGLIASKLTRAKRRELDLPENL